MRRRSDNRRCNAFLASAALVCAAGAALAATADLRGRETPELLADVRLDVHAAPDSLTVGDPLTLDIAVDAPATVVVQFPEALPAGGVADLLQRTVVDPREQKPAAGDAAAPGRAVWSARYTLAVFATGDVALPPWRVVVRRDSAYAIATTDSIRITVDSVLDDSLAAAAIRDLKPQATLPVSRWPWIVGIAAALAVAAALLWWWHRRRQRPRAEIVPLVRQRPADEVALEALRRLETRRLPVEGRFGEYYVALSEILRRYLEDGFGVAALEQTTEELLYDLGRHGFDRDTIQRVRSRCETWDLVKFAKLEPTIEDAVRELDRVRDLVTSTAGRMTPAAATATATAIAAADGAADRAGTAAGGSA